MANKPQTKSLSAENRRLKEENEKLKKLLSGGGKLTEGHRHTAHIFKKISASLLLALAVALIIAGNLLFWAGNTVVKTDRYEETVAPLIKDSEIQKAVAGYTTAQIFANVDVQQVITSVLPPRADFLAPTLTSQIHDKTQVTLQKVLANPDFQAKWNTIQVASHDRFISSVQKYGSDGTIDLNEVYSQLSTKLEGTKLGFLANKPLPKSVGSIKVASGEWLRILQNVINNIDLWRTLTLLFFVVCSAAAIYLSRRRRRTVMALGLLIAFGMFATLVSLRLSREIIANQVDPAYAEAVRHAAQIVFRPLMVQTASIMITGLIISAIAWLSGPYPAAKHLKTRFGQLLNGKTHSAIFSSGENSFTLWLANYKRLIEWIIVSGFGLAILFIRVTPAVIVSSIMAIILLVALTEILAADETGLKVN
jgi:hypothetical protein